jgi:hypothetical protein
VFGVAGAEGVEVIVVVVDAADERKVGLRMEQGSDEQGDAEAESWLR